MDSWLYHCYANESDNLLTVATFPLLRAAKGQMSFVYIDKSITYNRRWDEALLIFLPDD